MTANDAVKASQGFTRLMLLVYLAFLAISLLFAGLTVLTPEIFETLAYADKRIVMAIGYSLSGCTLLLIALHLNGRSNAALTLGQQLMLAEDSADTARPNGLFKPISALWALFFMAAIIITVNYIVLIYAVDDGLF